MNTFDMLSTFYLINIHIFIDGSTIVDIVGLVFRKSICFQGHELRDTGKVKEMCYVTTLHIKLPQVQLTFYFPFVFAASTTAMTFASHREIICAKPKSFT